jgi:GGDEF domain-containing protein
MSCCTGASSARTWPVDRGDEFAVVLHDIGGPANAEAVVRRIVAEMNHPVMVDGVPIVPAAASA